MKGEPPGLAGFVEEVGKSVLEDRDLAVLEKSQSGSVGFSQPHLMTKAGQSGGGHQTDITGPNNRYFHDCSPAMTALWAS